MKQVSSFRVSRFQSPSSKSVFQSSSLRVTRGLRSNGCFWALCLLAGCRRLPGRRLPASLRNWSTLLPDGHCREELQDHRGERRLEQYQKVIDEKETEKGKIYFGARREIQMARILSIREVRSLRVARCRFTSRNHQLASTSGQEPRDVESFLCLASGRGRDLFSSYAVKFLATETVAASRLTNWN